MEIMDPRISIVIGVTGHRDLRKEDKHLLEGKVREVFDEVKSRCPNSPITLLSPLAEGADRLVARVALSMGFRLITPLPLPIEEYQKDFMSSESLTEFKELLNRAERYFELPLVDGNTIENIRDNGINRDKQYEQVGAYIALHSQILIALWDGERLGKMAGTSKIVRFRLEGIPEPYAPARGHLDTVDTGPVYHIVTPRISNPMPKEEPFSVRKYYPDVSEDNGSAEITYEKILIKIDIYNHDIVRLTPQVKKEYAKNRADVIPNDMAGLLPADAKNILNHFAVADTLAQHFQKKSRQALVGLLVLVVVAFFFFQIYLEFFKHPLALLLYPATLGMAFSWHFIARRHGYQIKHLDYRAVAEGQRVQFFWNLISLNDDTAEHYLRKQKSELDWIRHAIRSCNISTGYFNDAKHVVRTENDLYNYDIVLEHWVNDQRNYYANATTRDKKKIEQQDKISTVFYWMGLGLACTMLFIHGYLHHMAFMHHIIVISITMSLAIAAAMQGYIEKAAFDEHIKQYSRMAHLYDKASKHLKSFLADKNVSEARHLIRDLGKEALMENGDWVLLHRSRPIGVPKG